MQDLVLTHELSILFGWETSMAHIPILCSPWIALRLPLQIGFMVDSRFIHKQHHKFAAPFGLAAEYAHPVETVVLGVGFFLGPLFLCLFQELHVFTMAIWLAVRLIQSGWCTFRKRLSICILRLIVGIETRSYPDKRPTSSVTPWSLIWSARDSLLALLIRQVITAKTPPDGARVN